MKLGDLLSVVSHLINVVVFIYFAVVLLKLNVLDVVGLSISAFGIFMSLIANIVSISEK
tara:strand:+ start:9630 stop:9806 length:177 start_codon:yes stop_codon:yes gene_type:complete